MPDTDEPPPGSMPGSTPGSMPGSMFEPGPDPSGDPDPERGQHLIWVAFAGLIMIVMTYGMWAR